MNPKPLLRRADSSSPILAHDKASVACILASLKYMSDNGIKPRYDTEIYVTVFEEVGHGGVPMGDGLDEMLAVDMGMYRT